MLKYGVIVCCFLFLFVILLSTSQNKIIDLSTGLPPEEFEVISPETIFEPFVGIPYYFSGFHNIKKQLFSWFLWLISLSFIISFITHKKIINIFKSVAVSLILFYLFLVYTIFFNLPKYKIVSKNQNLILVDFHSHTLYSHDGWAAVKKSIKWHRENGFDGYFITDHNQIIGTKNARINAKEMHVFSGEEIQDKYNNHLLILGLDTSVSEHVNEDTKKIVDIVHKNHGAVIVAHWWNEKGSDFETLLKSGIDGFEIYGHSIRPLERKEQLRLIKFCQKNNLMMVAGSNWHGWGSRNDLWSAIEIPGWKKLSTEQLEGKIIQFIRKRNTDKFKVVVLQKSETVKEPRWGFVFEPFVGLYYYFSHLNIKQILSWILWVSIFFALLKKYNKLSYYAKRLFKSILCLLLGLLFFVYGIIIFFAWYEIKSYNNVFLDVSKLFSITGIIFILFALFYYFGSSLNVRVSKNIRSIS